MAVWQKNNNNAGAVKTLQNVLYCFYQLMLMSFSENDCVLKFDMGRGGYVVGVVGFVFFS
jgi:hypothetical protein